MFLYEFLERVGTVVERLFEVLVDVDLFPCPVIGLERIAVTGPLVHPPFLHVKLP